MAEREPLLANIPREQEAPADAAGEGEQQWRRGFKHKKTLLWLSTAAIVLVGLAVMLYFLPFSHSDDSIVHYPGEKIGWHACGDVEGTDVECSSIDVPMDEFDKKASGDKTFSIPLARLRGNPNAKNLFVNPGGPGSSGVNFIYNKGKAIQQIVGQDFHILSFDPRGVSGSNPQAICFPDSATRKRTTSVEFSSDPVAAASMFTWGGNMARSCADTTGEYGKYINTPQTAADMNRILDAVGQEYMAYWGFSYGSVLGQTYANMFPERSERIAVDGIFNHFDWYNATIVTDDFIDSDNVLYGFFDECIKAGDDCPLSRFANNAKYLEQNVTKFIQTLKDNPFPVYINNSLFGTINYSRLWLDGYFTALFRPATWYRLAHVTAQLMEGNGTAALLAYGLDGPEDVSSEHNVIIRSNDGISGQPAWPSTREGLLKKAMPFLKSQSSFAARTMGENLVRSQWAISKTHRFVPDRRVKTRHPVLVLSTTYDPVCPLVSAKVARDIFVGARLVEVEAYGHCSLSMPSLCAAGHVRAFFNNGTMPDQDVKCPADGLYYINPDKGDAMSLTVTDVETAELMAALVELADAVEMPRW